MRNLDQIRAAHAIGKRNVPIPGSEGGEVVKKVPMLIRQNGLLAALAFACERKKEGWKNEGYHKVFEFVTEHLAQCPNLRMPGASVDPDPVVNYDQWLADQPSDTLRTHTAEIMAYLGYLRRYVQKGEE